MVQEKFRNVLFSACSRPARLAVRCEREIMILTMNDSWRCTFARAKLQFENFFETNGSFPSICGNVLQDASALQHRPACGKKSTVQRMAQISETEHFGMPLKSEPLGLKHVPKASYSDISLGICVAGCVKRE
jgi:hypothetical protein